LLVVGIEAPNIPDTDSVRELADALDDNLSAYISFFISFAVIGRYWVAHHRLFGLLGRLDTAFIGLNLLYLAFVAFLPFPTAVLGRYFENPLSLTIYAVTVAAVSGMEVVLFRHAHRRGLLQEQMPEDIYIWRLTLSLSPVVFFLLSIPVAFISTSLAVALWFGGIPVGIIANRWQPRRADDFY
jgi:TMEM175 potassium channel family protein